MTYIDLPTITDANQIAADALMYLMDNIEGWMPREGNLEVWVVEAIARQIAEMTDVASRVPTSIFRYFGRSLVGVQPVDAAPAQTVVTVVMVNSQGYRIPAGTVVGFQVTGSTLIPFVFPEDVVVSPGSTSIAGVTIVARDAGTTANGIAAGPLKVVDSLAFISTVTSTAITAGGVDAESDATYLDRLTEALRLLSPRPIIPADFAVLARSVAGVAQAVAVDGYDPASGTSNNTRTVAVGVVGGDGNAVPTSVKNAVDTLLQNEREVNFIVNVMDPTFTAINVAYTVQGEPGADLALIQAQANAAVRSFFDPVRWAQDNWPLTERTIRYLELATCIRNTSGVRILTQLSINGQTNDQALPGVIPLPHLNTVAGTVTAT